MIRKYRRVICDLCGGCCVNVGDTMEGRKKSEKERTENQGKCERDT